MCYISSHQTHKKILNRDPIKVINVGQPGTLSNYDFNSKNKIYTLELEIFDKNVNVKKKGFFIPRLFMHSFNIIYNNDSKWSICQSWFKEFDYSCSIEFDTKDELNNWIDGLVKLMKNFKDNPKELFSYFGYKSFNKLSDMLKHLENVNDIGYRIEIFM